MIQKATDSSRAGRGAGTGDFPGHCGSPDKVFRAFSDPVRLARWWGPKGFTNTIQSFDLRPGGHWRFVMHGPDGATLPNESIFGEVVAPERVVFRHVSGPQFEMTITFEAYEGQTLVGGARYSTPSMSAGGSPSSPWQRTSRISIGLRPRWRGGERQGPGGALASPSLSALTEPSSVVPPAPRPVHNLKGSTQ